MDAIAHDMLAANSDALVRYITLNQRFDSQSETATAFLSTSADRPCYRAKQ